MDANKMKLKCVLAISCCAFLFLNFKKIEINSGCVDCDYTGSIRKVVFGNEKYTFSTMQAGIFYYSMYVDHCRILYGDILEVRGKITLPIVHHSDIQTVPNVEIEKCHKKNGQLFPGEILTVSDKDGSFLFKTALDSDAYIIIHQTSGFGMCYEMTGFTKNVEDK